MVSIIRNSAEPAIARERLRQKEWPAADIADYILLTGDMEHTVSDDGTYRLSETQARAILDLRLQRLTAMGVKENTDELEKLAIMIRDYLDILGSGERIQAIIANELTEIKAKFAVPRRSQIVERAEEVEDEDLIEPEDMVITVTNSGYMKRTPLTEYRSQKRGGKGLSGMSTKDEDFVTAQFVANTHSALLFFTTDGMVYKLKTWRLPRAGRNARGKAIVNILPIKLGVSIAAMTPIEVDETDWENYQIIFATSDGHVRRNQLSDFANVMANGKIAMRFPEDVTLVNALICDKDDDVLLANSSGSVIRFAVERVRIQKTRYSTGMRGMRLKQGVHVVSMEIVKHFPMTFQERDAFLRFRRAATIQEGEIADPEPEESSNTELPESLLEAMQGAERLLLAISANGSGKLMSSHNFTEKGRGGQGIVGMGGEGIVAFLAVELGDEIMLTTNSGQSIRCNVSDVSFQSRQGRGVRVINLSDEEQVVSVARIADAEGNAPEEDVPAPTT